MASQPFHATVASQNHSATHKRRGICDSICCDKQALQKPLQQTHQGLETTQFSSPSGIPHHPRPAGRTQQHGLVPSALTVLYPAHCQGQRWSIACDTENWRVSCTSSCAIAPLELTAGAPDGTPALPVDDTSSEPLPQPGLGASATHGTPGGPGRTDLPHTLGEGRPCRGGH